MTQPDPDAPRSIHDRWRDAETPEAFANVTPPTADPGDGPVLEDHEPKNVPYGTQSDDR